MTDPFKHCADCDVPFHDTWDAYKKCPLCMERDQSYREREIMEKTPILTEGLGEVE